ERVAEPYQKENGLLTLRVRLPSTQRRRVDLLGPKFAGREPAVGFLFPYFQPSGLNQIRQCSQHCRPFGHFPFPEARAAVSESEPLVLLTRFQVLIRRDEVAQVIGFAAIAT